jgi:hypothetical protein
VVTATGHGYTTGDVVMILSVVGMTELNNVIHQITVIDANTYSLNNIDATGYTAYVSGGSSTTGTFYAAKEASRMADFTSGNTTATDNWGATGVAAMMDEIDLPLLGPISRRLGNASNQVLSSRDGSAMPAIRYCPKQPAAQVMRRQGLVCHRIRNQVLSEATSGAGYAETGAGLPQDTDSFSSAGTNLFGTDHYYQYIRNELFPLLGGSWDYGSGAGVFARYWYYYRTHSYRHVGFRCACYPE